MSSCWLCVCADDFSFEAGDTKPVILVGSCALEVARSIVFLDCLPDSADAGLRSVTLRYANGQALSPSPSSIPGWRREVCYMSFEGGGLLDPRYSYLTPLELLNEVKNYRSRFRGESRRPDAASLNLLQAYLQKLNLHSSCAFAPYKGMTASEKVRSSIALVLTLKPKCLILSGALPGFECAVNAILAEDIPVVWAGCDDASKEILLAAKAEVVNVDCRSGKSVSFATSTSRRGPVDIPRKWPEHRSVSSTRFESMCVLGGAWATLMSPVLADVGKLVASIGREVSQPSPMNDVHLWQVVAASLAIVAVLYGQNRLSIGLGKDLAVAAVRCVVQLNILGYLLVPVFESDSWWIITIFLSVMLAVAAQEGRFHAFTVLIPPGREHFCIQVPFGTR